FVERKLCSSYRGQSKVIKIPSNCGITISNCRNHHEQYPSRMRYFSQHHMVRPMEVAMFGNVLREKPSRSAELERKVYAMTSRYRCPKCRSDRPEHYFWMNGRLNSVCFYCRTKEHPQFPPTFDTLLSVRDFINDTIIDHCSFESTNNGENIPPDRPDSLEFWGRIERRAFVEVDDEEDDDEADVNGNVRWTGDRKIAEILRKKVSEADGICGDSKAYTYYCSQSSIFKAESKSTGIRARLPMERFQCEGEVYIFIPKSENVKYVGFRYRHAHFHKTPIAKNTSSELRKFIAENTRMSAREITNLFRQRRDDFPNDKHVTQAQIYFWWYESMQSSYLRDHNDEVQSAVKLSRHDHP
ncbi:hypothetical protein BKA69DRAFT_1141654, partial [Paraphysoderma sedebokerense]